jgi:spore photoproduct lyase
MSEKFDEAIKHTPFESLHVNTQKFLHVKAEELRLSFSQIRNLIEIAIDLQMWDEGSLEEFWEETNDKKQTLLHVKKIYDELKQKPKTYPKTAPKNEVHKINFATTAKESLGLGSCPVASPKTRCCNLMTLDAVESCGFDCSYCSIQSFYNQNTITFDTKFKEKLQNLKLDADKIYHIGTGQSSDSLMWGNKNGILEALLEFARQNPNVILEFKTKSDNISYLLENDVPKNILVTWSLNPQTIINNEEKLTASLETRIGSARKLADKGILVGFHFHPIIVYKDYEKEYEAIVKTLLETFTCKEVALVSMGTLTFIKPVLKKLRQRAISSKILQMPLIDASGKLSYPLETKQHMFSMLYNAFAPWHEKVFFYMCMEDISLWKSVFGYEYEDNDTMEEAMKSAYMTKIHLLKKENQ